MSSKYITLKRLWPLRIVIFLAFLCISSAALAEHLNLKTLASKWICHNQKPLKVFIAKSMKQREMGLSFFRPDEFPKSNGLYFSYPTSGKRKFWMPNTFFPLDIIFIDSKMVVAAIERSVLPSPKPDTPLRSIPTTMTYLAKDVLEIRHDESWGNSLKKGDQLSWCSKVPDL